MGRWMPWVFMAHARRYHRHYRTTGHVWQARFKAFPIEEDEHLISVLRYVERNALRAELVARAEDWKWSSLADWLREGPLLWRGDVPVRDERWLERVNEPLSAGDLSRLRLSVERGRPYGAEAWTGETARRLGLESTLRPRRRPTKRPGSNQLCYVPLFLHAFRKILGGPMTRKSSSIFDLMRSISLRPSMYGTPQATHGLVFALAIVVLTEELGGELAENLKVADGLLYEAMSDVIRERSEGLELCDERTTPELRVSYEAFRRHTDVFLRLLENHIDNVKTNGQRRTTRTYDEDNPWGPIPPAVST